MSIVDVVIIQPFAGVNGLLHDPPVSRTGNKRRFRPVPEGIFGYHRRDVRLEWANDLDLGSWLLALCYACPELAQAVSRIISSWVPCPECHPLEVAAALDGQLKPTPEFLARLAASGRGARAGCPVCAGTGVRDARQLWERLRREPIPEDVASAAGVWACLQARGYNQKPIATDGDQWVTHGFTPEMSANGIPKWGCPTAADTASRFASLARSAPSIVTRLDAGLVTPERFASVLAGWMCLQSRAFGLKPVAEEGGRWSVPGWKPEIDARIGGVNDGWAWEDNPRWTLASSIRASDTPAIVSRLDAGAVVPEVLARWLYLQARAFSQKPYVLGTDGDGFQPESREPDQDGSRRTSHPRWNLAESVSSLPAGSLLAIDAPEGDLPLPSTLPWTGRAYRVVVFCDPSYLGTDGDGGRTTSTGYGATFTRAALIALVAGWLEAGRRDGVDVTVGISESCDLSAELEAATGQKWYAYDIGSMVKKGSSFWAAGEDGEKKQSEWLTTNRAATRVPAVQVGLFGG